MSRWGSCGLIGGVCTGVGHQVKLRPLWCTWAQTADVYWENTLFFCFKKATIGVPKVGRSLCGGNEEVMENPHVPTQSMSMLCLTSGTLLLLSMTLMAWSPSGRHIWNLTEHADLRREIKLLLSFRWWCHRLGGSSGWPAGWLVGWFVKFTEQVRLLCKWSPSPYTSRLSQLPI